MEVVAKAGVCVFRPDMHCYVVWTSLSVSVIVHSSREPFGASACAGDLTMQHSTSVASEDPMAKYLLRSLLAFENAVFRHR